jgi:hypothetical protein
MTVALPASYNTYRYPCSLKVTYDFAFWRATAQRTCIDPTGPIGRGREVARWLIVSVVASFGTHSTCERGAAPVAVAVHGRFVPTAVAGALRTCLVRETVVLREHITHRNKL